MTIVHRPFGRFPGPMSTVGLYQPLIARDELVASLDRMTARKVTMISAPVGSGKTSLLRAWAELPDRDRDRRLALVQVRRDQHDAQPFWLDLLAAVRQAFGTTDGEPPTATPDFNGRAMVDRVLAELAEHRGRVVLVIDDAHELASTEALAQLARLLTSLPPQAHAIVSTRRDLWLGLHQLRLAGELAEIRAADLRFTGAETRELLEASGVRAVRDRDGAAAPADRRLGRGPAAGGVVPGRPPRPGAVRRGVLRHRPDGRGLPDRRDARTSARRGTGSAPPHLAAGPGQRRASRRADRAAGLGTDLAGTRGRERVRGIA